jgi:hypothetical protein
VKRPSGMRGVRTSLLGRLRCVKTAFRSSYMYWIRRDYREQVETRLRNKLRDMRW